MKLFRYPVIEFFDKGVSFCWTAFRNLHTGFTCADSVMGPFIDIAGTPPPRYLPLMKGGLRIWQLLMMGGCLTLPMRVSTLYTILPIE